MEMQAKRKKETHADHIALCLASALVTYEFVVVDEFERTSLSHHHPTEYINSLFVICVCVCFLVFLLLEICVCVLRFLLYVLHYINTFICEHIRCWIF